MILLLSSSLGRMTAMYPSVVGWIWKDTNSAVLATFGQNHDTYWAEVHFTTVLQYFIKGCSVKDTVSFSGEVADYNQLLNFSFPSVY